MTQQGDRGWNRMNDINPFITHPAHKRLYHTTGVYAPYSLRTAVLVLLRPTRIRTVKQLWDGDYGFSSLSGKTRMFNHLKMAQQRQHILHFKILSSLLSRCLEAFGREKKTGARDRDTGGSLSPRVSPLRAPSFFEPTTSKRPPSRLDLECWPGRGFNLRPLARQTSPLPIELTGRRFKKY